MRVGLEILQFVPVVTFAFRFLVAGEVDLASARGQFVLAAALAALIVPVVLAARAPVNPILLGADLWLAVGALAFALPLPPIASAVADLAGCGLFLAILATGIGATVLGGRRYVGVEADPRWSWALVGLTALVVAFTWFARADIRLGGGLPFIVLNVVRRGLSVRLSRG